MEAFSTSFFTNIVVLEDLRLRLRLNETHTQRPSIAESKEEKRERKLGMWLLVFAVITELN